MRKSILLLVLVLALVGGSVMAQSTDLSSVDPTGQTITYWHQFSSAQLDTMTALVKDFNDTNPYKITVDAVAEGTYNQVTANMNAAIIAGTTPNLVAGYANDAASYWKDKAVADITPYLTDAKWGLSADEMKDLNMGVLNANKITDAPYNGAMVALAHQNSAQVLVTNMTLLKQIGYDHAPKTIDEFKDVACKASKLTGPKGEDIQGFPITTDSSVLEAFIASQGGNIYHDGKYDFTSDAAVASLQLLQDLYKQGCGYIPATQFGNTDDFALGLNVMATTSTAGFTFIIGGFQKSGVQADWAVSTLPYTDGNQTLQVFVPSIVLVSSTPEKQLASWLFLKYLLSADSAAKWSAGTGYFNPVISSAAKLTADTFPNKALFPYFDAANKLQNDSTIHIYTSPSNASYGKVRELVGAAIGAVTSGGQDVAATAQKLETDANQALVDSQS